MMNQRKFWRVDGAAVSTSEMGFELVGKTEPFDFTVRILGAGVGKLTLLNDARTTTLQVKAHKGREKEVRELFESVDIEEKDFFYSVSIPYIDWKELVFKLRKMYREKE